MTVTLELTDEMETKLRRKAEREGLDITSYLYLLIERALQDDSDEVPLS